MLLVDTSVWIDHFRNGQERLIAELSEGRVYMHPWVCGELACGNLRARNLTIAYLNDLPSVRVAEDSEVFNLIAKRKLWGCGIGWVDAHLLVSALLSHCEFWTLDRHLKQAAIELGVTPRLQSA